MSQRRSCRSMMWRFSGFISNCRVSQEGRLIVRFFEVILYQEGRLTGRFFHVRRWFDGFHIESTDIKYTVGGSENAKEAREVLIFSWDVQAEPAGLF